jgi:hypothetical protein
MRACTKKEDFGTEREGFSFIYADTLSSGMLTIVLGKRSQRFDSVALIFSRDAPDTYAR